MTTCEIRTETLFMAKISPDGSFADWLASARADRGLSQEDLAERAEISQEYLSLLERGNRKPSSKVVRKLAVVLILEDTEEADALQFLDRGLIAAGHAPQSRLPNYADPLETITRELGYDSEEFSDEEKRQMRAGLDSLVIGFVEKDRRERQKQSQRK